MPDIFQKKNKYDDEGNLMVNQVTLMESGTFTYLLGTESTGSVQAIYDANDTTSFSLYKATDPAVEWLKWDFGKKTKFKNIYVYYVAKVSGGTGTVKLQGSNDNTAWTDITSSNITSLTEVYENSVATSPNYRYIRFIATPASSNWIICGVFSVKAVA